ncbi:DUF7309 domain-containing protein [Clostridium cochlearium]|uniref:DUF7309 domain-containing protein n=1 Tax=Clostridium cochlearium TaxID=1494 RepID=UPI000BBC0EFE|nr:hypothetical protein [Clostridium cochlearium]MBU5268610.1 hypothetical protein [Clostridium cochlearium]
MRIEATLEEWRDLYDIAIKLKEMKPWEELWDMDLITILPHEKDEPCICSVMGKGGEYYGIGVYIGIQAIQNFFVISNNEDIPSHQLMRYQNNILCNFGSRDELTKKERDIIKELGLKFRGKNNWIYFRVFEKGYASYMPNRSEVLELTDILGHLYMAIKALRDGLKVDFEGGKTLMRRFSEEDNLWVNYEMPVFIPEIKYPIPTLEDELLVKRLKKKGTDNSILELDIAYLNLTINEKGYDKPLITRLCVLVDTRSGVLLSQIMVKPEDDEIDVVFGIIINHILQKGKPKRIIVRDGYIFSILMDLCKKIGIEVLISQKLIGIDEFIESLYEHMLQH